jgi:hypothetical protein
MTSYTSYEQDSDVPYQRYLLMTMCDFHCRAPEKAVTYHDKHESFWERIKAEKMMDR